MRQQQAAPERDAVISTAFDPVNAVFERTTQICSPSQGPKHKLERRPISNINTVGLPARSAHVAYYRLILMYTRPPGLLKTHVSRTNAVWRECLDSGDVSVVDDLLGQRSSRSLVRDSALRLPSFWGLRSVMWGQRGSLFRASLSISSQCALTDGSASSEAQH